MTRKRLGPGPKRTSALTETTTLAAGDMFPVLDVSDTAQGASGSLRKASLATLQKHGLPRTRRLDSQHSIASTTGTEVTDLQMTLEAGTFTYKYSLIIRSSATGTGIALGVNFTGTGNPRHIWWFADATAAITAESHIMDNQGVQTMGYISGMADSTKSTTTPAMMTTLGVAAAATDILCVIEGIIIVTAGGDLELWHGSESGTATSVEVGSSLVVHRTDLEP